MSMKVICDFLFDCSYTKCDVRVKTNTQKKGNESTSIWFLYVLTLMKDSCFSLLSIQLYLLISSMPPNQLKWYILDLAVRKKQNKV